MSEILSSAQMRGIEQQAIASGAVAGLELMERAGAGVVAQIATVFPDLPPSTALILCGPGNNGGDGFVIARLLHERGWDIDLHLLGDPARLPPDARSNYQRWAAIGPVTPWNDAKIEDLLDKMASGLVVDALFGTGLTRPMPPETARTWHGFATLLHRAQNARPQVVAVDIPSGLCSDSGRDFEGAFWADLTVSFHRAKWGHYLAPSGPPEGGAARCGLVVTVDIGLPQAPAPGSVQLVERPSSFLGKTMRAHKYGHGHALVLAGGAGKGGAARLAARAALRVGAGLVTVAASQPAIAEHAAQLTAIMLRALPDGYTLRGMLQDERLNALCLGPGLGAARAQDMVPAALWAKRATVLDADALTAFADDPAPYFAQLHDKVVLTPHLGEFRQLFPDLAARLAAPVSRGPAYSKIEAVRAAAARAGCVVLLKGPDTVIADPSGRAALHSATGANAAPWLATAGSGDVLAGLACGLMARGHSAFDAAANAAWLHAAAARAFGPGLIAEDLPEMLPQVFRELGL
ncbi:NAD(P)H-hydrate dehydratase [Sinirhodobacter sp. WL0062]|uniref:Bifunctional NAD(P)H-hydrate repair enzyme n=1 Tax=Rhodobacter flavimaris TaxID=2907145 RepID=A0ABS8YS08_9RHOB|nr:NAD(P)H-hydrate dehydratase [Sinirhodobacter sp. WL0062]MCE5972070.1 NAD(P)H-hydrate dehydratase [Sinirhodobacter sp. WL0062]